MKSYLKFLSRNKLYTFIEVVGLSVSMAFIIIIFCYVKQQYAVTKENPHYKNIYVLAAKNSITGVMHLTYGIKDVVLNDVPEVETATRYSGLSVSVKDDDQFYYCKLAATDRDFFNLFPYRFIEGSAEVINDHSNVIVSESFANTIANDNSIIGKYIKIGDHNYVIAAVIEDFKNTLFSARDIFVNIESYEETKNYQENPYDMFGTIQTYIKVYNGTNRADLEAKINSIYPKYYKFYGNLFFQKGILVRLNELFFSSLSGDALNKGNIDMIRVLLVVGFLILISAVLNYINLNVALTSKRAKEMAMRRLLGSSKYNIIWKFIGESIFFTLCCCIAGILIAYPLVPIMNTLIKSDIGVSINLTPTYILDYLIIVVVIGMIAGLLPAIFISSFSPIDVMRGRFKLRSKMQFSKVFIVIQNFIAIILISLTITMQLQMRHMQNRPMGCNTKNLYYLNGAIFSNNIYSLAQTIEQIPWVKRVGFTYGIPGNFQHRNGSKDADGKEIFYWLLRCDTIAFNMFGFNILERYSTPTIGSVWFTETAMKAARLTVDTKDKVMDTLAHHTNNIGSWGGIISDIAIHSAAKVTTEEYAIVNIIEPIKSYSGLLIETSDNHLESKAAINKTFVDFSNKILGNYREPFFNGYIDDIMEEGLAETARKMRLIELFMLVAVILSLLGLVAMSAYFASERKKTIAISKVFGGTMESETRKNLRDYLLILVVANILAIPLAIWVCNKYLLDFVYRIKLSPWIFVVTVLVSFSIAIASVLWQIIAVAKVNPVDVLQKE